MPRSLPRLIAVLVLAALPAGAFAAASAGAWTSSLTPALVSGSVFRGQERGDAALQTTLESSSGGLGAGLWASFPLEGSGRSDPGTEADLYAFGNLPLPGSLTLVPGATLYIYPRAARSAGLRRTTFEPSLGISATFAGVRFTPKLYQDVSLRATTLELATTCALALPSLGTELDWSIVTGTYLRRDDAFAPSARTWGNYWQAGVSLPYQITARNRLIVGWTYASGTGAAIKVGGAARMADPRAASRGLVSVGFSSTF